MSAYTDKLKPCPFCGSPVELKDYTDRMYGFWDYIIVYTACRAYMDSPSTSYIRPMDNGIYPVRNDETKAQAKTDLIRNWNRRTRKPC